MVFTFLWCKHSRQKRTGTPLKALQKALLLLNSISRMTPAAIDYGLTLVASTALAKFKCLLPLTLGKLPSFNWKLCFWRVKGDVINQCKVTMQAKLLITTLQDKNHTIIWENVTDTEGFPPKLLERHNTAVIPPCQSMTELKLSPTNTIARLRPCTIPTDWHSTLQPLQQKWSLSLGENEEWTVYAQTYFKYKMAFYLLWNQALCFWTAI